MPAMNDSPAPDRNDDADRLRECVARAIDERVRPELGPDGEGIDLVGLDGDRIVQVRLTGACGGGCSSAAVARLMMVDVILRAEVPGIRFVEAVP